MSGFAKRWGMRIGGAVLAAGIGFTAAPLWAAEDPVVPSYTGCLGTSGDGAGRLVAVKEGNSPRRACTSNEKQIALSSGDITSVFAGPGMQLTEGAFNGLIDTNGQATIGIRPNYQLPQGCTSNQQPAKIQGGWKCAAGPEVVYGKKGGGNVPDSLEDPQPAPLHLPAGDWSIVAKLMVFGDVANPHFAWCELRTPGEELPLDESAVSPSAFGNSPVATLTLGAALHTDAPVDVQLRCGDQGWNMTYRSLRIIATRVPKLTSVNL